MESKTRPSLSKYVLFGLRAAILQTLSVFMRLYITGITSLSLSLCPSGIQSQHFNYTWMRHVRQQDVCLAPQGTGNGFALQLCDNTKAQLRWFHKSSNSALVGWLWVCRLLFLLLFVFPPLLNSFVSVRHISNRADLLLYIYILGVKNVAVSWLLVH